MQAWGKLAVRVEYLPTTHGGSILRRYVIHRGDRVLGYINPGKSDYFSHRVERKHYSFRMLGYGIDADLVEFLNRVDSMQRVVLVVSRDDGIRKVYLTPLYVWLKGTTATLNPDWGPQVFVTLQAIVEADRRMREAENVWEEPVAHDYYPPLDSIEA